MVESKKNEAGYEIYFQKQYKINLALSLTILMLGILGVLPSILQIFLGGSINKANIIGGILALCFGTLQLLDAINTLFIISPKGIEYHRAGYKIFIQWEDIKKAELRIYRRHQYVLILRKSTVIANRVQKFFLRKTRGDLIIPLEIFAFNWQNGHIGDLIRHYAPQAKIPNQPAMRIGWF